MKRTNNADAVTFPPVSFLHVGQVEVCKMPVAYRPRFYSACVRMKLSHIRGNSEMLTVTGTVVMIWFFIWWKVVKSGPEEDPNISPEELKYIQDSLGVTPHKVDFRVTCIQLAEMFIKMTK
jgi:hypothetical protein